MIPILQLSVFLAGLMVPVIPAAAQSLEGTWQSQGYGNVYEIRGVTLKAFEVTARTCVPGFTAKRLAAAVRGREATFKSQRREVFFISDGSDDDHKLLNHADGLASIRISRLPRLPTVCDAPTADTPPDNFEVFTRTFAEHYIGFDLRHIDWDKMVADNRPKVTSRTTPARLFQVLDSMLKQMGDLHTSMQIQYGLVNDTTGYIRILGFGSYAKHARPARARIGTG